MPAGQLLPLLRCLRKIGTPADGEGDRALLERFARQRDGEAFAALVRRHGPMVLAVCRRLLRHSHDAADAFQAVFLLLVRRAGSLRRPEQLGPWLHGVARRVALKARALGPRRREEPLAEPPPVSDRDDLVWRDLRPVLDDAIRSLPAKYRAPVVLCYLEGMTHAEAARHLGCPPGTLATRLSRARDQLRARLVRRGVTLSAGALAAALAGRAEASVSPALVSSVLRGLVCPSAIPSHVTVLTEGVCQAMLMEKLRFVVMALVAVVALGALALGYRSSAGEPPVTEPPAPPTVPMQAPAADKEPMTSTVRTKNFEVTAPTALVARLIADAAERHRKEQAVLWLGEELPAWERRCPIKIQIAPEGCGGATTFEYADGKVTSRGTHLEGSLDRLLSSALPHEITHTVLADYFGAAVPRWADEGASMLSEVEEEQQRYAGVMRQLVDKERLMPVSRLFRLREYPDDVMAFYAEGHSVAQFLVERKGRKTFLAFVKQGMKDDWDGAAKEHYGFGDVKELDQIWLKEVRKEPKSYPVVEYGMPAERTGLPEGPLPGTARLQPDGKGVLLDVIQTRMHYRWTFERARDGTRKNGGLRPLVFHEKLEAALPLSEVKAYQLDGTAIDVKKLPELLKKATPVIVTPARSGVHERWLPLVKEGTLVIEVKAADLKEKKEEPLSGAPLPGAASR
jgi:RNA polymerase sigma factor (sigma-70 family)